MTILDTLPPLPEPMIHPDESRDMGLEEIPYFTADQLREYAAAAVQAEREACARVREEADSIIERLQNRIASQEAVMRQALKALQESRPIDPFDLAAHDRSVRAIAALSKALEGKNEQ